MPVRQPGGRGWSVAAAFRWTGWLALCLLLAAAGAARAQNTSGDNPTGAAGDFNGDVTSGCRYDPYTGNAKRVVTDLVVPGSNGAYPLAFTRTFNSNLDVAGEDNPVLGDGVNWRHSYQWAVTSLSSSTYEVSYPDGTAIVFGQSPTPFPAGDPYLHGPAGTSDRLEVVHAPVNNPPNSSPGTFTLHTSDGGQVKFENSYYATHIVDPNGATTTLTYYTSTTASTNNPAGYLSQVTEPGGRWLQLAYKRNVQNPPLATGGTATIYYYLLDTVTASTSTASNPQSVSYSYSFTGDENPGNDNVERPYANLAGVTYNSETSTGGGNVAATYGVPATDGIPQLASAVDPHFAGPMSRIQYGYSAGTGTYVLEERNYGSSNCNGLPVSHLSITESTASNPVTTSTETRRNVASSPANTARTFNYGQGSVGSFVTHAPFAAALTSFTDFQGNSTAYSYDGHGFKASMLDASGYTTAYVNEPITGKVTQVTLPDGCTRSCVWTGMDDSVPSGGNLQLNPYYLHQTTDERGNVTTYTHDHNTGLVTGIAYADGTTESFGYQSFSSGGNTYFYKVASHTLRMGATIFYGYDASGHGGSGNGHLGLLTSVTRYYADGYGNGPQETTELYNDGRDRLNKSVDPRGVTDSYTYDGRHQLLKVVHAADSTFRSYTYDDYGRCLNVQNELGKTTTTAYDEYGRVVSVTQPVNNGTVASRTTYTTYDWRDNSNTVVADALLHTSSLPSYQVLPSGRATQNIYSPNGWLTDQYQGQTSGSPANPGSLYFPQCLHVKAGCQYDALGRLLSYQDAQGGTWQQAFDSCGRLLLPAAPRGHTTPTSYYDPNTQNSPPRFLGLPAVRSTPSNSTGGSALATSYTNYDYNGRLIGWTSPGGVDGPANLTSTYTPLGGLISQSDGDPSHPALGYGYDELGRKISVTYADQTAEHWHYDADGNVSSYQNRAGNKRTIQNYDARMRPDYWTWTGGVTAPTGASFDAAGQCTQLNDSVWVLTMAYDDAGSLKSEQQGIGGDSTQTVTYTPDVDGNVASVTYPDGEVATWPGLDGLGRVQQVEAQFPTANGPTLLASCGYTGERFYYSETSGGVYNLFGYQANGRVNSSQLYHASGANISHRSYGFHPNGQLSWMQKATDNGSSGSAFEDGKGEYFFAYEDGSLAYWGNEAAGVAASANAQGDSEPSPNAVLARQDGYEYDQAGNRTYDNENGVVLTPSFDTENRQAGVSYDANGNATSVVYNGATYTFTFNDDNELISASGGGHTASFTYDGKGRLCARTIDGATTYLYYAGSQVVEQNNGGAGKVATYYYFGPGGKLACRTDAGNNPLFYHYDARGEVTHLTNGGGAVQEQYLYAAFGLPYVFDATGTQYRGQTSAVQAQDRFLWMGGGYEWYPEFGLYRCGARFYCPMFGRFMQPDPIGQQGGLNIYAYCKNDPINASDPTGNYSVGNVIGAVWSAPNSIIGLGLGIIGIPFGATIGGVVNGVPIPAFSDNGALQFTNNYLVNGFAAAITFGNVINYGRPTANAVNADPNYVGPSSYGSSFNVNTGMHEDGHVIQYDWLGPLFLPAYLALEVPNLLANLFGFAYQNPLEGNADSAGSEQNYIQNIIEKYGLSSTSDFSAPVPADSTSLPITSSSIFTNPESPYFDESNWNILGIGESDSNALGLDMFTSGSGFGSSSGVPTPVGGTGLRYAK